MRKLFSRMLSAALCTSLLFPVCTISSHGEGGAGLVNLFPKTGVSFAGIVNAQDQLVQDANYVSSDYIEVSRGDRLYFGAAPVSQSVHLLALDADKKPLSEAAVPVVHAELDNGYAVFVYYVPSGVKYVRFIAAKGVFDDGDYLVTRNQPFDKDAYHAHCGIPEASAAVKNHPLYGKKALFLGDSHAAGSYDSLPSYRNPSKSWARRLAVATGLHPTNAAVGGATISEPVSASDYIWVWDQFTAQKDKEFDVIFVNGGGNDARRSRQIGEMLDTDDPETLHAADGTFAGGLQWLIYNIQTTWPEADVYYIASFRMDDAGTGNYRNIADYYAVAKQICERYGVLYIDLYDNDPLYAEFDYRDRSVMPDRLHPLEDGYEIVGAYVVKAVNEILGVGGTADPAPSAQDTTETQESADMPEVGSADAPDPPDAVPADVKPKRWPAVAIGAAVALVAGIAAAAVICKKRRR